MRVKDKTKEQPMNELAQLRQRIAELEKAEAERKRAEEALRESEHRYRALFEGVIEGVFVIDAETMKVVLCNPVAAKMYGFDSAEDAIGANPLDFVHPDNRERALRTIVEDMFEKDLRQVNEFRTITKDGEEKWISALGTKIEFQGEMAGLISIRDITERKRAEEELRESEEKHKALVNQMDEGYIVVQGDRIVFVNRTAAEGVGRPAKELIGYTFWEFIAPETLERAQRIYERIISGGKVPRTQEFVLQGKDGRKTPFEASFRRITYEGQPGYAVVLRDITERKRAEEEIARHAKRVEALHAVAQTVSQTLDLQELLDNALAKVLEVMDVEAGGIFLLDIPAGEIHLHADQGVSEDFVREVEMLKLEEDELERAMQGRDPFVKLEELFNEANLAVITEAIAREGLKMFTIVPLWVKGQIHGTLGIASHASRQVTPDDIVLLQAMGSQIAVAIDNAMLFEQVSNMAIIDGMTGAYNHRYFQERLEEEVARTLRFSGECSLIILDLDHFKIYNDLFGHVAGDEALKRVGQVLRDYSRQVDIACRYGGEEFAVILPQTGSTGAYETAERLRKATETALALESSVANINLTVSLGVASWPNDGLSREELIHQADLALHEAKQRGRNQTCLASEVVSVARAKKEGLWEVAEHLEAASLNTIYALAAAVDARDHYTYGHSRSVSKHAVAIGKALGLSRRRIGHLRIAALLHDIGKIGLSDSIIRKPGPLNEEEWVMMRKHSELGATIINHTPELADCAAAIQHHHEWYDGKGYPSGLEGEAIPLEARIIAIADAYDTMTTPRAYRQMVSPQEAIEELRRQANTQFDPLLVETFAQVANAGVASTA